MNTGTPEGRHDEFAVNWILPASISSLSFFITSLAHCLRLGLEMSPNRKLATGLAKGWRESCCTGRAEPCTAGNAPPNGCVHPPGPDWRFGTFAGCAAAGAANADKIASTPLAMSRGFDADLIIVSPFGGSSARPYWHLKAAYRRSIFDADQQEGYGAVPFGRRTTRSAEDCNFFCCVPSDKVLRTPAPRRGFFRGGQPGRTLIGSDQHQHVSHMHR